MHVDTETLAGPLLNWATAKAVEYTLGNNGGEIFKHLWISNNHHVYLQPFNEPDYKQSLYDPLHDEMQFETIVTSFLRVQTQREDISHGGWSAKRDGVDEHIEGQTEKEAVLRCFVHSIFGHTIDISSVDYINSIDPN